MEGNMVTTKNNTDNDGQEVTIGALAPFMVIVSAAGDILYRHRINGHMRAALLAEIEAKSYRVINTDQISWL
jgi:hypothetical protein